ncbi:hypothetical protein H7Y63_02580 [Polaromonas sp.]|nr:hypothetical protein [Candidatus Saccharibacteria bacterium]
MPLSVEQIVENLIVNRDSFIEERPSLQASLSVSAGVAGGIAVGAAANKIEEHSNGAQTSFFTDSPKPPEIDGSGVELTAGALGFALVATATYVGIKKWALRHMTVERYKELKSWPMLFIPDQK